MKFNIITIFPNIIKSYCSETILARAQKNKIIHVNPVDLRAFTLDRHKTVDDTPYGGGAGMVMKPEPLYKALHSLDAIPFRKAPALHKLKKVFDGSLKIKKKTIMLSPRGTLFDQRMAEKLSVYDEITFVCGRYEGVDQRVVDHMVDEEISVGPYVLAGGELGALIILEAVSRLLPGVLGNPDSLNEETHGGRQPTADSPQPTANKAHKAVNRKLLAVSSSLFAVDQKEYPQYTKPADFKGWKVPEVLMSGDHKKIEDWRKKHSG